MRFRFEPNQDYQIEALEAIADLFRGQIRVSAAMRSSLGAHSGLAAVPNRLDLDERSLLSNLHEVQARNRISSDPGLKCIEAAIETLEGPRVARFPNFSVEMETGTGKTYVYLRAILDLNRRYGMRKFIVVVPSVAIRNGVLKTLSVTEEHFRSLYDNAVYRSYVYDSANLSLVRQFALSDTVEVMVMTIDSFNKSANVIRQSVDRLQGETPLHLVQAARPILILDEPQNMESEKSISALAALDPLFALRFSATHRNPYNLIYRMTPAEAYRRGLVKRIEVHSVVREDAHNLPYVRVEDIRTERHRITARLRLHKLMADGTVKEVVATVKPGDSLEEKTGRREYAECGIDEINPGGGFIRLANNVELRLGQEIGADREAILETQIRETVREHFQKQARLRDRGIKVLSLIFIDRVDNYVREDGVIRRLFQKAFDGEKRARPEWRSVDAETVQAAYFAQKRRRGGAVEWVDSFSGENSEDQVAYDLIMRDKETLLSFPTADDDEATRRKKQVCFIFSHSALREGWDNPNVFQICTLNQTGSQMKKRQEVGRGVRLAVNQDGERIHEDRVNILTVVANESYKSYVETLQREITDEFRAEIEARLGKPIAELTEEERRRMEEEYRAFLPPAPRRAGTGRATLTKRVLSPEFGALWARIKHKTRYAVHIDTEKLLGEVVQSMERASVPKPRVTITKAQVKVGDDGIFEAMQSSAAHTAVDLVGRYPIPNLVALVSDLLEHTSPAVRITRRTLLELFRRVKNKKAAVENPHGWATVAARILKERLAEHLVNGVRYERLDECYEMRQILDEEQVELFSRYVAPPEENQKLNLAVYDRIPCDSDPEVQFVKALEARDDVKVYMKLPKWFKVPTPVGNYEPDWAIVMDEKARRGRERVFLVCETKGDPTPGNLRRDELHKIECAKVNYGQPGRAGAVKGVRYRVVTSASDLP